MKICENKRACHCLTFDPGLSLYYNFRHLKATGPIVTSIYKERPWAEVRKVCSNRLGHMTKMAGMPIHCKNLYKSSSLEPVDRLP